MLFYDCLKCFRDFQIPGLLGKIGEGCTTVYLELDKWGSSLNVGSAQDSIFFRAIQF